MADGFEDSLKNGKKNKRLSVVFNRSAREEVMLKSLFIPALMLGLVWEYPVSARQINPEAKSFTYSTTVEKERPQLNEKTKKLIAAYRRNPTKENYIALRRQAEINYDKVVARKRAKLEELKQTAKHVSKVEEMQKIVDEMIQDRENRINQTMSRFTDPRLRPNFRQMTDGYLPVLGAAQNVSIAYAPVTNEEYAVFIKETGKTVPEGWVNGNIPVGKARHPVVNVSYNDAVSYCSWLSAKDGKARYRLPTEREWELAAGHMPKDADMNCGENRGTTPVTDYAETLSASGAVDMWGNVWEWTSTQKGQNHAVVKGGSWSTPRTHCRTEYRDEVRRQFKGYDTVGFRVIREQ